MVAKIAFFMFPPVSAVGMGKPISASYDALWGIRELSKIAQSHIPAHRAAPSGTMTDRGSQHGAGTASFLDSSPASRTVN
jgi:hypothetical protein